MSVPAFAKSSTDSSRFLIRVSFSPPVSAEWDTWRQKCHTARDELIANVAEGESPSINDALYKDNALRDIYRCSRGPFFGKCTYCETPVLVGQYGDIEHWRPKGAVSDMNGNPVDHPGYYWLAYDWRNLLLSCITCNRKWKKTRFPVNGSHASEPGGEHAENPLLVNPLWDDPEQHLYVDKSGVMIARTDRGRACIEVCGLNRPELVRAREREARLIGALVELLWAKGIASGDEDLLQVQVITDIKSGKAPYAATGRAELRRFRDKLDADA